jgi:ABC-2 type transport system ATP-binding protein
VGAAVEIRGVVKRFDDVEALKGVSADIEAGRLTGLVGPDGAGKTTLIRLMAALMKPSEGTICVVGSDVVGAAATVHSETGYMPQRFGLYDDLTVAENLAFYADIYRVPKTERQTRVPELLGFANLAQFQDRLAGNLSGGMKQKLGLICTLVHRPEIIFLDEPTFGVDPVSRREFWQILYQLLVTGITIFLSTSYMDEAERAHRVGLLHRGHLLLADTPRAVKASFRGELLEARNGNLHQAKVRLEGQPLVRQLLLMGDRLLITVEQSDTALGPLAQHLAEAGLRDVSIKKAEPGLEDVFVQVISRAEGEESKAGEGRNS